MTDEQAQSKGRKKFLLLALIFLVLAIAGAGFGLGFFEIPRCDPDIQSEVDWPPDHHGFFEESSHNELRVLEAGAVSPIPGLAANVVTVCNIEGAAAADAVATVPTDARFVVYQPDQNGWEYALYHSVEIPDTRNCLRVPRANRVEGLVVEPSADNPQMVTVRPPAALEPGGVYMFTAGSGTPPGVVVRVAGGAPPAPAAE